MWNNVIWEIYNCQNLFTWNWGSKRLNEEAYVVVVSLAYDDFLVFLIHSRYMEKICLKLLLCPIYNLMYTMANIKSPSTSCRTFTIGMEHFKQFALVSISFYQHVLCSRHSWHLFSYIRTRFLLFEIKYGLRVPFSCKIFFNVR